MYVNVCDVLKQPLRLDSFEFADYFCLIFNPDVTYLDHTGATIYGDSQLKAYFEDLSSNLYGNPHSQNSSSQRTLVVVEQIRDQILHHFNTDSSHYDVIFTNGCTGALKLLADVFPWESSNAVEQRAEMEGDRFYNFSQDGHLTSPG